MRSISVIVAGFVAIHVGMAAAQPTERQPYDAPVISDSAKQTIRNRWQAHDASTAAAKQIQPEQSPTVIAAQQNLSKCVASSVSAKKSTAPTAVNADQILGECASQQTQLKTLVPEGVYSAMIGQLKSAIVQGASGKSALTVAP